MRKMTSTLVASAALLLMPVVLLTPTAAGAAGGSFANREIGLSVSGFGLLGENNTNLSWGLPISLEAGFYIDSGFTVYLHVPLMVLQQKGGYPITLGTGGQLGLKYLFLEESIRPYVFLQLDGLYLFRTEPANLPNFYAGPGIGGGVDFFVAESVSLGLRANADLFIYLAPGGASFAVTVSLGGGVNVTTYF
jgi:outer membrane protein